MYIQKLTRVIERSDMKSTHDGGPSIRKQQMVLAAFENQKGISAVIVFFSDACLLYVSSSWLTD